MSWQSNSIQILRVLINDLDIDNYTYEDDILEQILIAAAMQINQEVQFSTTYTISICYSTITPDPSDDEIFMNFLALKAACLINNMRFQDKALVEGIRARCGPAELQVTAGRTVLMGLLQEGPCKLYEKLKEDFNHGNVNNVRGILSPFISNNFQPYNISTRRM